MTSYSATARFTLAGRYSVGELIGRGGMGDVRTGWDQVLDRPVAVKVLREDAASNPLIRRRFEAEAKAAARLVHPNIVQVYDSGEDSGIPFLVMERLSGRSLRDEIEAGRLSVSDASDMALQVLAALDAAHAAGLVHRDIKPANILTAGQGEWKVADFGIAKSVEPSGDDTVAGVVLGTPAYLPPERLLGGGATPASDLYSLGVILYEAMAGTKPFQASDPAGWMTAVSTGPRPLRELRPEMPPALAAVIERSMARDPAQRFTNAGEMAAAVQAARSGEGARPADASDATGWMAIAPAMPLGDGQTDVLPTAERDDQRRLWVWGLAAALALLLVASIALAATGGGAKAHTPAPPTTAIVQVTTTTPPATTVPAVQPPPAPHDHPGGGKGGGGKGDH